MEIDIISINDDDEQILSDVDEVVIVENDNTKTNDIGPSITAFSHSPLRPPPRKLARSSAIPTPSWLLSSSPSSNLYDDLSQTSIGLNETFIHDVERTPSLNNQPRLSAMRSPTLSASSFSPWLSPYRHLVSTSSSFDQQILSPIEFGHSNERDDQRSTLKRQRDIPIIPISRAGSLRRRDRFVDSFDVQDDDILSNDHGAVLMSQNVQPKLTHEYGRQFFQMDILVDDKVYIKEASTFLKACFSSITLQSIESTFSICKRNLLPTFMILDIAMDNRTSIQLTSSSSSNISLFNDRNSSQSNDVIDLNNPMPWIYKNIQFMKTPRETVKRKLSPFLNMALASEFNLLVSILPKYSIEITEKSNIEQSGTSSAKVDCTICYETYSESSMIGCSNDHKFCSLCVAKHVETELFGKNNPMITCMSDNGCKAMYPSSRLQKCLTSKVFQAYEKASAMYFVNMASIPDLVKCRECGFACELSPDLSILSCPECRAETCRHCNNKSHIPLRCEEVEANLKKELADKMSEAKIRKCCKCGLQYLKEEGCNMITCSACGTVQCYLCRKMIQGSHFCQKSSCGHKPGECCKQFTNDNEEIDNRKVLDVAASLAKERNVNADQLDLVKDFKKHVEETKNSKKKTAIPTPTFEVYNPLINRRFGEMNYLTTPVRSPLVNIDRVESIPLIRSQTRHRISRRSRFLQIQPSQQQQQQQQQQYSSSVSFSGGLQPQIIREPLFADPPIPDLTILPDIDIAQIFANEFFPANTE